MKIIGQSLKWKKKSREKNIFKRRVFNYQNLQLSKSSSVNCCVVSHRKLTWMRTESVLFPFIKMIPTSTSTLFNKNIDYNRVACKIAIANLGGLKFIFGFKTLIWLLLKQYTLYHTGVFFFFLFFFCIHIVSVKADTVEALLATTLISNQP